MSCSNRCLRNLDTTVYRASDGCCSNDDSVTIQFIDRTSPCCQCGSICPPYPCPPVIPAPPVTPVIPTASYALFANNAAAGVTYTAGQSVAFPATVLNTDAAGIANNGSGTLTLSGGTSGRAYLINYQLTGTATTATVGLVINGTNAVSSDSTVSGTSVAGTFKGSYIVNVPANAVTTVALNVISGTVATASPTAGTNISVIRIA